MKKYNKNNIIKSIYCKMAKHTISRDFNLYFFKKPNVLGIFKIQLHSNKYFIDLTKIQLNSRRNLLIIQLTKFLVDLTK